MRCPECESDDVYRARVAWEAGTSSGQMSTIGASRESSSQYSQAQGYLWGRGATSYEEGTITSQATGTAERLAPPPAPDLPPGPRPLRRWGCLPYGLAIFIWVIVCALNGGAAAQNHDTNQALVWSMIMILGLGLVPLALNLTRRGLHAGAVRAWTQRVEGDDRYQAALAAHAKEMEVWERLWTCGRCGHLGDQAQFEGAA